jgi:hypothetical protein
MTLVQQPSIPPSPPLGAERAEVRWGEVTYGTAARPTSPSPSPRRRVPSLSPRKRAERVILWTMILAGILVATVSARSAPSRAEDPNWPCQQRLVPKLSAAAYWNGPSSDNIGDWRADPAVADLVRRLAPRRVSTEEGLTEIAAFAKALSGDRQRRLGFVFYGLLDASDRERAALIEKLKQIGHHQRELADLVSRLAAALDAIPADATGDAATRRIELQQRHDFTARNFEEIQHTIRYACETPVALDARFGAWARALQAAAAQ